MRSHLAATAAYEPISMSHQLLGPDSSTLGPLARAVAPMCADCGSYHCAVCGFGVRCTGAGFVSLPAGVAAAGRIERVESLSETEVPAVFCGPVLAF